MVLDETLADASFPFLYCLVSTFFAITLPSALVVAPVILTGLPAASFSNLIVVDVANFPFAA